MEWHLRRNRRLARLAAGVAVLGLLMMACRSAPAAPPANLETCTRVERVPNASSASLLPSGPCDLPTFDFARFQRLMDQLRGTPVVVNVWGSLCGPCIHEAPQLATVARRYEGKVQFVGVDRDTLRALARGFILKHGYPYPSVLDPNNSVMRGLGVPAPPYTMVFDASGRRVFTWPGAITEKILLRALAKIVVA
jgi:thiol-disulfide isomerase/thioredoxin